MSVNPTHAPRQRTCRVCTLVAVPEDVTIRLYDRELEHLPLDGAAEYLSAVGLAGTERQLKAIATIHRRHVDRYILHSGASAPAQITEGLSRIAAPIGDVSWVDVNQGVMAAGAQATAVLAQRLRTEPEQFENRDLVAVMAVGGSAATMRANAEMKGQIRRAEAYAKLASGLRRPNPDSDDGTEVHEEPTPR